MQGDVDDFGVALEAAGYRGDRLSVWGLQVFCPTWTMSRHSEIGSSLVTTHQQPSISCALGMAHFHQW